MESAMDFPQPAVSDVSIDFGSADVGVTEQFLDDAQIGSMLQQMRREAVPEHVRRHIPGNAGAVHPLLNPKPECECGERRTALG